MAQTILWCPKYNRAIVVKGNSSHAQTVDEETVDWKYHVLDVSECDILLLTQYRIGFF